MAAFDLLSLVFYNQFSYMFLIFFFCSAILSRVWSESRFWGGSGGRWDCWVFFGGGSYYISWWFFLPGHSSGSVGLVAVFCGPLGGWCGSVALGGGTFLWPFLFGGGGGFVLVGVLGWVVSCDSMEFGQFPNFIIFFKLFSNSCGNSYIPCFISNNRTLFYLWWNKSLLKH